MQIGHEINAGLWDRVDDPFLARKQQVGIENVHGTGVAIGSCRAVSCIDRFGRASRKIVPKNRGESGGKTTLIGPGVDQSHGTKEPTCIGVVDSDKQPRARHCVGVGGPEKGEIADGHFSTPA